MPLDHKLAKMGPGFRKKNVCLSHAETKVLMYLQRRVQAMSVVAHPTLEGGQAPGGSKEQLGT